MSNDPTPYVNVKPGDLITSDLFNTVQSDVKKDIAQQIQTAIGGVTKVKSADDASTLGGLSTDQLTSQILDKVKAMIPGRTGYQRVFRRLQPGVPNILQHNLGAAPVVDVYQLEYFQVVCAQGENASDAIVEWVNFYIYHSSEAQVRGNTAGGQGPAITQTVRIEDPRNPSFRIRLKDMLAEFGVDTTNDGRTLDELVTNFWSTFFSKAAQNDPFDPNQYCHSPWMEKCCGELRTIKELRDRGDWDNIWFKMLPRKTINYPAATVTLPSGKALTVTWPETLTIDGQALDGARPAPPNVISPPPPPGPTQVEAAHLDLNTAAVLLVADPIPPPNAPDGLKNELPVMIIMKA
ncbi:MAG TPA: hypothetical protein VE826_06750 [Dongiaceae bacterium]|nr:hypothetical protein [Dongiaceae bacterium]